MRMTLSRTTLNPSGFASLRESLGYVYLKADSERNYGEKNPNKALRQASNKPPTLKVGLGASGLSLNPISSIPSIRLRVSKPRKMQASRYSGLGFRISRYRPSKLQSLTFLCAVSPSAKLSLKVVGRRLQEAVYSRLRRLSSTSNAFGI